MTDTSIARVVKTYQWIREKMSSEEMQMLSSMLYIDVLRMGSERIKSDEQLKMESFRARTSWKNQNFTPLSWEKKAEPKAEKKTEKKAEKAEKTEKTSVVEKKAKKETFRPLSNPELSHEEWEKVMLKNSEEQMNKLPF